MHIIIAGGGTGGHLFPGIAIAEEFRERDKGNSILFVGTEKGIEARVLPALGWPLRFIKAEGIKGKGMIARIRAAFKLVPGFFESVKIILSFKPDMVIGVGGYASAPLLLAAKVLRIKTAVHEQNALPGLANRLLGRLADVVFISFEGSQNYFPRSRVLLSGNPLRKKILEGLKQPAVSSQRSGKKTILIFGGSLGAHGINMAVMEMIRQAGEVDRWGIIHQTGEKDYKEMMEGYANSGWKADVRPFIDDMDSAYRSADLVICRAGATTIAELTAMGKPSILIPYPFAADDHQRVNAESLVQAGGAVMILEKDLGGDKLASEVKRLLDDGGLLDRMGDCAKGAARSGAAGVIVDESYRMART